MAICESWLDEKIKNESLEIPGFGEIFRKDRPGEAYGGVALYLGEEIHHERRLDLESENLELMWVSLWTSKGKILLGVAYRPPSSPSSYWDRLCENIDQAMGQNLPVVITGDLNCNTLERPNKLEDLTNNLGVPILNTEPTHYTTTAATCIDVAITTSLGRVSSVITTAPGLSNHSALIVTLDCHSNKANSYKKKILNCKKTDWELVNNELVNTKRDQVDTDTPLDNLVATWSKNFQKTVENFTPTKTVTVQPWSKSWYNL